MQICARHWRCKDQQEAASAFQEFVDGVGREREQTALYRGLGKVLVSLCRKSKSSLGAGSREDYSRKWGQQVLGGLLWDGE